MQMRFSTGLAAAVLALILCGTGKVCAAQTPSGSYQQTCRDIGVRGSTLYAECQNTGGGWQRTELRDFNRCNGDVQNNNGSLQCGGSSGYGNNGYGRDGDRDRDHDHDRDRDRGYDRDHRYPRGSYEQTCQNITVNGNNLQASCQKKNGKLRNTSLHNFSQCRDIENDNGKLRCR
jgi:hypothetical protein